MYLRSWKLDSRIHRRRRGGCARRLLILIIAPLFIFIGVGVYQNRAMFVPIVDQVLGNLVNQGQQAIATMQAPTATPTADPSDNIRLAESAWRIGNYQDATRLYGLVINSQPNDVQMHYRYTLGLIMAGRDEEALVAAENTVTANPFHPDAWTVRAMALIRLGQNGEAIASALRALELVDLNEESLGEAAPKLRARARAYLGRAYAAPELGRYTQGLAEVNRALEEDPENYDALLVRGYINRNYVYDFDAARLDFQNAYDSSGQMPHIGLNLALLDLVDPEYVENGLQVLNEILERNPENTPALYWMGNYYRITGGDLGQSETYLQRCVAADPENADCIYELGRVQERNEQYDIARLSFERAVELGGDDYLQYYWAGYLQRINLGDCGRAAQYLQQGYQMAQQSQAESPSDFTATIISNFEDEMAACNLFVVPSTPAPELETPDEETEAEDGSTS